MSVRYTALHLKHLRLIYGDKKKCAGLKVVSNIIYFSSLLNLILNNSVIRYSAIKMNSNTFHKMDIPGVFFFIFYTSLHFITIFLCVMFLLTHYFICCFHQMRLQMQRMRTVSPVTRAASNVNAVSGPHLLLTPHFLSSHLFRRLRRSNCRNKTKCTIA